MKLIGTLTSPFVRKVRIVLSEKRIDYEFEIDIPWNEETRVGNANPLGKVPVLILDDGEALFDSRVIVAYLDTLTPVARLIPDIARSRVQVKRLEALADGICDAAALIVLERRRPPEKQSAEWILRQKKKVDQGLQLLALELGEKSWCMGDAFSLADIAVGCCLGYLDLRFPDIGWRESYPNLSRLEEKLMKRTGFSDTVPRDI
ncbi:MAG TPA: glutathione S-transferase [Burkholderiales bacterium]|nr:glutathione S-transferase [Burkholderiales bacterium]